MHIRLRLVSGQNRQERNFESASKDSGELSKRIVDEFLQMLASTERK